MTRPKKKTPNSTDDPKIFKRFGSLNTTKIGSININPDLVAHHLNAKPGEIISFIVGPDGKSLLLRKLSLDSSILPKDTTKEYQNFLEGEDTYSYKEWEAKKKEFGIK